MDIMDGALWVPTEIVQYIQDVDPTLYLCHVCKNIKVNRVKLGIKLLEGKRIRGRLGQKASIMFAYSSGQMHHLRALVPPRILNNHRHHGNWRLGFCRTYEERMNTWRVIMWIPMMRHLRLLKTSYK